MKITVQLELSTALNNLSFIEQSIEEMRKNANSPEDYIALSDVEKLQTEVNNSIMKQTSIEDVCEAIGEIRE